MSYTLLTPASSTSQDTLATGVSFARYGNLCVVTIAFKQVTCAAWSNVQVAALPSGVTPIASVASALTASDGTGGHWLQIREDGTVYVGCNVSALNSVAVTGQISFAVS